MGGVYSAFSKAVLSNWNTAYNSKIKTARVIEWNGRIADLDKVALAKDFAEQGYAIIHGPGKDNKIAYGALQNLLFSIGYPQGHERGDDSGIAIIQARPGSKKLAGEFKGLSSGALDHHTDGSFLCHVISGNKVAVPPDIILLQCVRPAKTGGETELCDWQAIWNDLNNSSDPLDRMILKELLEPQFTVKRGDLSTHGFAVFTKGGDDVLRVRWHNNLKCPPLRNYALTIFKQRYLQNERYLTHHRLLEGEILVLNNVRMTHARTDYVDSPDNPRRYHRVFVISDLAGRSDTLQHYGRVVALGDAEIYRVLERPLFSPFTGEPIPETPIRLSIGIKCEGLPDELRSRSVISTRQPIAA